MDKKINTARLIKSLNRNEFVLNCRIPMGYGAGIPLLQVKNNCLCLTVPFLKYQITGEIDKTLVYPIRNTVTFVLPEGTAVGFEDLRFNPKFLNVDFSKPIGLFRPDKLKKLNKTEYDNCRNELFELYDKLVLFLLGEGDYSEEDETRFSELLKLLIEPYHYPVYKALDIDFYNKYLV